MHHTPSITFEPTFVIAHVVGFGDVLSLSVGAEKGPVMGASKGTESVRCATGTSEGVFIAGYSYPESRAQKVSVEIYRNGKQVRFPV